MEREAHLLELSRYLALNPVRAGLVQSPSEWRWGSFRALAGLEPPPEFLEMKWIRELFRSRRKSSCRAFEEFVAESNDYDPWSQIRHQVYLGSDAFCSERLGQARDVPRKNGVAVCQSRGLIADAAVVRKRMLAGRAARDLGIRERNLFALLLRDEALATFPEIGAAIDLSPDGARTAVAQARKLIQVNALARNELAGLKARLGTNRA